MTCVLHCNNHCKTFSYKWHHGNKDMDGKYFEGITCEVDPVLFSFVPPLSITSVIGLSFKSSVIDRWSTNQCFIPNTDSILSLSHHPQDKTAAISHATYSEAFSWMKSFVFWFRFHWRLFLRVQLIQHWFRWWLGAEYATSHFWTNADPIHWRTCAAIGGDGLRR